MKVNRNGLNVVCVAFACGEHCTLDGTDYCAHCHNYYLHLVHAGGLQMRTDIPL